MVKRKIRITLIIVPIWHGLAEKYKHPRNPAPTAHESRTQLSSNDPVKPHSGLTWMACREPLWDDQLERAENNRKKGLSDD